MATLPRTRSSRSSSTCEAVIDEAVVDEVDLGDKESRTAQAVASVLGGMSRRKAGQLYKIDRRTIKK